MKYFIISDTHGNLDKVYEVYKTLEGIDAIIHLGDYEKDAVEIRETLKVDVISVRGNMDGGFGEHEHKILETECGKLYLAHGHLENVKMKYQNIYYYALENQCVAALFGHTHKAVFENLGDMYLINPGSLTLPADGSKGTYVILQTSKDGLNGQICKYEDVVTKSNTNLQDSAESKESAPKTNKANAPKVQGGYLRSLLNYSDRF